MEPWWLFQTFVSKRPEQSHSWCFQHAFLPLEFKRQLEANKQYYTSEGQGMITIRPKFLQGRRFNRARLAKETAKMAQSWGVEISPCGLVSSSLSPAPCIES